MLKHLKTNTTVSVLDKRGAAVAELQDLPALKLPSSPEIVAIRDIPAGRAFEFYFREAYDITQHHFLQEGETRYKVVGVNKFDTPRGSHTEVEADTVSGTQ